MEQTRCAQTAQSEKEIKNKSRAGVSSTGTAQPKAEAFSGNLDVTKSL
jgi:hypothetical protein